MKLQLQMFVQDSVDETIATCLYICCKSMYMRGLMKLQLQMFVQDGVDDRVDETTATNVCIEQG